MKHRIPRLVALATTAALSHGAHAQQPNEDAQQTLPSVTVSGDRPGDNLSIDAVSATASRLGLTPRETPASVTIVDRATIEQRGATDTQDILAGVPGLTAAAPPGSAGAVSYRGFGTSQITQLFNGITVQYDAIAGRPVDAWIYDRVEVIGGPSTFLFGAGAVGGSINYITRLAHRDGDEMYARVSAGSFDTTMVGIGLNRKLGSGAGVGNHARIDVSRTDAGGWVDGNQRTEWTVAASLLTDLNAGLAHTLALEYQNEHVDRPYWGTPVLRPIGGEVRIDEGTRFKNYNSADGIYEQTVTWVRSLLEVRLAPSTTLRNTLYRYDALRDYRNVEVYEFNAANTAVARSSALLQRHDQQLTGDRIEVQHKSVVAGLASDWAAGLDVSLNEQTRFPRSLAGLVSTVDPFAFTTERFFDIPGMVPGFNPDRTNKVRTLALFIENRTRFGDRLAMVTGLRRDAIDLQVTNHRAASASNPAYFERTYRPVTGRAGLVYDLAPGANAYAQYATAADPPAGILSTASYGQVRNFDLTTGRQFELGSKFDFADGKGVATVAAYAIRRRNLAITDPANPTRTIPVGQQSSRGIELAAAWRASAALLVQGNLAYVDAQYDDFVEPSGGVPVSRAGKTPPNVPARVVNLWLTRSFGSAWEAGADLRHVSARDANNANTISAPAYTLLGAFATYRFTPHTHLTLRGRNLTDKVYARWIDGTPQAFLGAPRSYEIALQTRF